MSVLTTGLSIVAFIAILPLIGVWVVLTNDPTVRIGNRQQMDNVVVENPIHIGVVFVVVQHVFHEACAEFHRRHLTSVHAKSHKYFPFSLCGDIRLLAGQHHHSQISTLVRLTNHLYGRELGMFLRHVVHRGKGPSNRPVAWKVINGLIPRRNFLVRRSLQFPLDGIAAFGLCSAASCACDQSTP